MVSLHETNATSSQRKGDAEIMVGDVALLKNDSTKRVLWKLAIVKELLPGNDDRIRAAVVQVAGSRNLFKRSIKHLIPIEVRLNIVALNAPEGPEQCRRLPNPVTAVNRSRHRVAIYGELLRRLRS